MDDSPIPTSGLIIGTDNGLLALNPDGTIARYGNILVGPWHGSDSAVRRLLSVSSPFQPRSHSTGDGSMTGPPLASTDEASSSEPGRGLGLTE